MNQKLVHISVLTVFISFLFCGPVFSLEETKPARRYLGYFLLENNAVYGITSQKTKDGKYIPVELTGEEKVKVVLNEFTMKNEVTIDMLKPGGSSNYIVDILQVEKKISVNLLFEWVKDKNPLNRGKAAYLLDIVKSTNP